MQSVQRSCLIDEIKKRLKARPGKDFTNSVFTGRDGTYDVNAYNLKRMLYEC